MAAANVPITRDLLGRLAAGTAGVVGGAFLRRLVAELGAALDAEVAFVAELVEERPGHARTIASATAPGIELGEASEFELAGTPGEHAVRPPLHLRAAARPVRREGPLPDRRLPAPPRPRGLHRARAQRRRRPRDRPHRGDLLAPARRHARGAP